MVIDIFYYMLDYGIGSNSGLYNGSTAFSCNGFRNVLGVKCMLKWIKRIFASKCKLCRRTVTTKTGVVSFNGAWCFRCIVKEGKEV